MEVIFHSMTCKSTKLFVRDTLFKHKTLENKYNCKLRSNLFVESDYAGHTNSGQCFAHQG